MEADHKPRTRTGTCFFFFFTCVTGPRRSLSLKLGDTRVYEPQLRAPWDVQAWMTGGFRQDEEEEEPGPVGFLNRYASSLLLSSLKLSDTQSLRARLGTAAHLCEVVALTSSPYMGYSESRTRTALWSCGWTSLGGVGPPSALYVSLIRAAPYRVTSLIRKRPPP